MAPYRKLSPEAQARVAGAKTNEDIAAFVRGETPMSKEEKRLAKSNPAAYLKLLEERVQRKQTALTALDTARIDAETKTATTQDTNATRERVGEMTVQQKADEARMKDSRKAEYNLLLGDRNETARFAAEHKAENDAARNVLEAHKLEITQAKNNDQRDVAFGNLLTKIAGQDSTERALTLSALRGQSPKSLVAQYLGVDPNNGEEVAQAFARAKVAAANNAKRTAALQYIYYTMKKNAEKQKQAADALYADDESF